MDLPPFHLFSRLMRDQRGMETAEWAVLAAMIVSGLALTVFLLGESIKVAFLRLRAATE